MLCTSPKVYDEPLFEGVSERLLLTPEPFAEKDLYHFTFNILKTCGNQEDEQAFLFEILSVQIQALKEVPAEQRTRVVTTILSAYEDYCLTRPFEFFESLESEFSEERAAVLDECKKTPIGQLYCAAQNPSISADELIRQYEKGPKALPSIKLKRLEGLIDHFRARALFVSDEGVMDKLAQEIKRLICKDGWLFFSPTLNKNETELLNRFLEMTFDWVREVETDGKEENLTNSGVETMETIYKRVQQLVGQRKGYALGALDEAYGRLGVDVDKIELEQDFGEIDNEGYLV